MFLKGWIQKCNFSKQHYDSTSIQKARKWLANLPTLSTPYLCPATWCDSGTQPFRWVWPCGPCALWPHFSSAGGPPECRWARLTLTAAEHGFRSSLPRAREDSITTWRCLDMGGKQTSLIEVNLNSKWYAMWHYFLYSTMYVINRRTQFAWARYVIEIIQ